ncbi:MAG: hypothetical protein ABIH27_02165 [Candidatus Omnitrophota bacterium]
MEEVKISRINLYRKLDLLIHFIVALVFSAQIYFKSERVSYVAAFVIGSIFIDLDHFIDYFFYFRNKFSLSNFCDCAYLKSGKVYVFLHSWEINALVFALGLIVNSTFLLMLSLGLSAHLMVDNLFRRNKLFCFLLYRGMKKFNLETLLPEITSYYSGLHK